MRRWAVSQGWWAGRGAGGRRLHPRGGKGGGGGERRCWACATPSPRPLSESLAQVHFVSGCRGLGPRGCRARKLQSQVPRKPSVTALAPGAPPCEPPLRVSQREISKRPLAH